MAYQLPTDVIPGLVASGDLSADQFKIVKLDGSGEVALTSAGTDTVSGVLQDAPAAQGRAASVASGGVSKVVAGAAVAIGIKVMSDAAGKAIAWTAGNYALGISQTAVGAVDELLTVNLRDIGLD